MLSTREGLDDKHGRAAMAAYEGGLGAAVIGSVSGGVCGRRRLMQEVAGHGDVALTVGVGEQAVVADAMKAGGQHVQQEAAHELVGRDGHHFVARSAVLAVVLPAKCPAYLKAESRPLRAAFSVTLLALHSA